LKWVPTEPAEHIWSEDIGNIHERLRTGRGGNHAGGSFAVVAGPGANSAPFELVHIKDLGRFARLCLFGMDTSSESLKFAELV